MCFDNDAACKRLRQARIKLANKGKGYSTDYVAKRLKRHKRTIERYEEKLPSPEIVDRLCRLYGVEPPVIYFSPKELRNKQVVEYAFGENPMKEICKLY